MVIATPKSAIDAASQSKNSAAQREFVAEFALRHEAMIRRRIRGKLGPSLRRLFDSQDIMSTLLRRLDLYVSRGNLNAGTEAELWTLILQIAQNAVVDKSRLLERLRNAAAEDIEFAHLLRRRLEQKRELRASDFDLNMSRVFELAGDVEDQRILWFWLCGHEFSSIAELLSQSPETVRKRWQRIRGELRAALGGPDA